ncbi:MAG: hypothetical protein JWP85_1982 [Rhodoglobus sp.]|nr:hypothetical protein [Rhodoglobus sp.]
MSADDDRFDPRFDPAFQRGYDGPVPTSAPATNAKPRVETPVQHRVSEQEQPARRVEHDDRVDEFDDADDVPARRANPFLIALGVVALALVGGGLYLISRMRDLFASTQNQADFDFVTMQVLMGLAPIIVCLGLATAIGVLFIYAVRWGRPAGSSRARR